MKSFLLLGLFVLVFAVTIVWAGTNQMASNSYGQCLSEADVVRHLDHSRHGIAVNCNRAALKQNLLQETDQ